MHSLVNKIPNLFYQTIFIGIAFPASAGKRNNSEIHIV